MPEWIGKTIGNVRIEKLLARGGMAEVYLGTHLTLDRQVAIKLLHSFIEEEPVLLERFHREAKVVASLRHPNIVQIFDFNTFDSHPYIVMEYLSGPTLATYMRHLHQRKKRLTFEQIAGLLRGLTDAMGYAHRQGVIHRDIKPGNIMLHNKMDEIPLDLPLMKDVEAILTDFGLVRVAKSTFQTASGFLSGTPAYMSPEQARGDQVDERTDLYSLAVVLYEMLAGRVPFQADNTVTVLHMHIHTPPPPVPGISPKVQDFLNRALAKNPDDRYQTSQDMADGFYRAVGMAPQAEIIREPYPLKAEPSEAPFPTMPEALPEVHIGAEPEPQPKSTPRPEAEARSQMQPDLTASLQPRMEPKRVSKPGRNRAWLGVGVLSLVLLSILAVGGYRLFSAGPPIPEATAPMALEIPDTGLSPLPSETPPSLPPATGMVKIEGGAFEVGTISFTDEYHVAPQQISLATFWIDQYQTTNADYQSYISETGAPTPVVWPGAGEKHPVRGVTWDQADTYCRWMQKRLPDEAEWEAAGRGSGVDRPPYPWGNDPTADGQALSLPNQDTYVVGTLSFNKSPFAVFDMVGNIWEWVGEPYSTVRDGYRILRGGRYGLLLDLSYRLPVAPDDARYLKYAGFRCAADAVK